MGVSSCNPMKFPQAMCSLWSGFWANWAPEIYTIQKQIDHEKYKTPYRKCKQICSQMSNMLPKMPNLKRKICHLEYKMIIPNQITIQNTNNIVVKKRRLLKSVMP